MQYLRTVDSVEMDDERNVVTINSHGSCSTDGDTSAWAFAGPIAGFHFVLMMATNIILFRVRNVGDRYQEQKYVALASGKSRKRKFGIVPAYVCFLAGFLLGDGS